MLFEAPSNIIETCWLALKQYHWPAGLTVGLCDCTLPMQGDIRLPFLPGSFGVMPNLVGMIWSYSNFSTNCAVQHKAHPLFWTGLSKKKSLASISSCGQRWSHNTTHRRFTLSGKVNHVISNPAFSFLPEDCGQIWLFPTFIPSGPVICSKSEFVRTLHGISQNSCKCNPYYIMLLWAPSEYGEMTFLHFWCFRFFTWVAANGWVLRFFVDE